MNQPLSAQQEAEALQLANEIAELAQEELLQMARTMVASNNATLFGEGEFKIRDILLRLAAKAYQHHLEQKKTDTREPA